MSLALIIKSTGEVTTPNGRKKVISEEFYKEPIIFHSDEIIRNIMLSENPLTAYYNYGVEAYELYDRGMNLSITEENHVLDDYEQSVPQIHSYVNDFKNDYEDLVLWIKEQEGFGFSIIWETKSF